MRHKLVRTLRMLGSAALLLPFLVAAQAPAPVGVPARPAAVPSIHIGVPQSGAIRNIPRFAPPTLPRSQIALPPPAQVPGIRPGPAVAGTFQGSSNRGSFSPSHRGDGQEGDEHRHRRHLGYGDGSYGAYGYGAYPFYGYSTTYVGGDLNYDPNDPNNVPPPATGSVAEDGAGEPPPYNGPAYRPAYGDAPSTAARRPYNASGEPPAAPGSAAPVSDGLAHPRVTLIFRDGRAPLEIQNYAATQTKIFISDNGRTREVAISDLDVTATQAANDQNGVDFSLPSGR